MHINLLLKQHAILYIATDAADHRITNAAMHVIWARGQVAGYVHHVPDSGLEHSDSAPSMPNYYYTDDFKYHGRNAAGSTYGHRGFFTMNFFGNFHHKLYL